jgi:hypothetical protein
MKGQGEKLLAKLTGMVKACNTAFKQIEEHENELDARVSALEKVVFGKTGDGET